MNDERLARAAGAVAAAAMLWAGMPAAAQDELVGRVQVEQKIRLAARLIADPPTLQRIAASGHAQARSYLDEGRVHQAAAEAALAAGDLPTARQEVDRALQLLGLARRLVPDGAAKQQLARRRYEDLLASVERLLGAWQARLNPRAPADGGDLVAALGLLDVARQQGGEGRFDEAVQTLSRAEAHVLDGMNRTLHAATLDYTVRAGNPAEEFRIELARHDGFVELVPVALRDLQPGAEALTLIARYGEAGHALRGQALQRFESGDVERALADLRSATQFVQRALGAAGVATPPPIGSLP